MITVVRSLQATWNHWLTASTNRKIFGATATIAVITGLVKLAVVSKEVVVASRFGTSDALDAFLIAFIVPSFVVNVIAGSFNAALIPTYIQVREHEGASAAGRLYASVMTWSLGLLALAMLLVLVGAPFYLPWLATGFGAEKITLARELLYVLAPLVMLTGVITIWGSVLTAGERFALPALTPITTPLVAIAFVVIGGSAWGIFALAVGTVGGAGLEAALLGFALKRQGVHLRPVWHGADAHLRRVIAQYIPMIAGAFLMSGTNLVDQAMAAMLAPGSVAALNYGNRIIGLPLNLAASALGTAVIPYFSGMVSRQDWAGVRHTFYRYLGLILATTVPLTLLLVLFSELLVRVVFERGAFTAQDTVLVARVQSFFSLQIPFFLAGILVVRLISAMHANQVLMWGAVINLVVNIVLAYLLMMRIGVAGIALATSVMYFVSFAFLYYNWRRLFKDAR